MPTSMVWEHFYPASFGPGYHGPLEALYCNIKSAHTETIEDGLLFCRIVTRHARLFNTLSPQSLMEIGSFSKHKDELRRVKGALSAGTFSSLCASGGSQKSNGERSDF